MQMRYLVIGGQARGVGKTALVVDIIRAFSEVGWAAVKVSPHGHGVWPEGATPGQLGTLGAAYIAQAERNDLEMRDSARYLKAGARQGFLVHAREGNLTGIVASLEKMLAGTENVILESNSILEVLQPDLFLMVLNPSIGEFKESARRWLSRVDGFVAREPISGADWRGIVDPVPGPKPIFEQRLGEPLPEALRLLIRNRLFVGVHPRTT